MTSKLISGVLLGVLVFITSMTVEAAEFSGSWTGTLSGSDGSAADVQIEFSLQGFPLYTYINNKGLSRQAELSQVGQTVEYVPAGGGVQRVVVKSVEKRQGRLSVDLLFSFEKASQGYLQQKQETALFEYALVPDGMKMRVTTQATSHFGDKDMIVGGHPNSAVVEGVLQKVH